MRIHGTHTAVCIKVKTLDDDSVSSAKLAQPSFQVFNTSITVLL